MRFAAPIICLMITGCSSEPPQRPVSVDEVIENIRAWDGKEVEVHGFLGECRGMNCMVFENERDARVVADRSKTDDKWLAAIDRGLGIGASRTFDQDAEPLQFSQVAIRARINDECWPAKCSDRAWMLEPISISALDKSRNKN